MAVKSSASGYSHRQKNGNVSYTTAKGHEHIVIYNKKTNKMSTMWGKKFKVKSRQKKSAGGKGG